MLSGRRSGMRCDHGDPADRDGSAAGRPVELLLHAGRCVDLPLIVQDASSYVGAAIPTSFFVRLLDEFGPEKILFKPEGAPIGPNISDLRDQTGGRARMFDGSGGILLIDAIVAALKERCPASICSTASSLLERHAARR